MLERHSIDYVALLFGLMFLAIGAGYIVHETTNSSVDPAWIVAIACATIGSGFLALTVLARPRRSEPLVDATPAPTPDDDAA